MPYPMNERSLAEFEGRGRPCDHFTPSTDRWFLRGGVQVPFCATCDWSEASHAVRPQPGEVVLDAGHDQEPAASDDQHREVGG